MQPLRILHTGDWHVRDKDIDECRKVLNHMVDFAAKDHLDLIIIAGDLTDRNDVKFDSQTARLVMEAVSSLSESAPVFIITGTKSHDGNIPELLQDIRSYYPIYVSTRPEQVAFVDEGAGPGFYDVNADLDAFAEGKCLISSVPTPTKQYLQSLDSIEGTDQQVGELMGSIFANFGATARQVNIPHVLVGHWQVGGAYVSETQQLIGRDIEISTDQIMSASPDLAALGHIHLAQQIRNHPIFYCGSSYRKDYGEMEGKGFYAHEVGESGLMDSEWHELPTRKLIKVNHDYTVKDINYEIEPLIGDYSDGDIQDAHVRIEFKVWQDQRDRIEKDRFRDIVLKKGAAAAEIQIVSVPRQNIRAARVMQVESLRDKLEARAEIVGDTVPESIMEKCDVIETDNREAIIKKAKEAA